MSSRNATIAAAAVGRAVFSRGPRRSGPSPSPSSSSLARRSAARHRSTLRRAQRRALLPAPSASAPPTLPRIDRRRFATALGPEERSSALADLIAAAKDGGGGWTLLEERDAVAKTFHFVDFAQAWEFMGKAAVLAEEMNHHPEWLNVYNRVEVTLTTHDCNGLSTNDIEMATKMNEFEQQLLSP